MIKSVRDLTFNYLKISKEKLEEILVHIDDYYYTFSELKFNTDDTPKLKNGIPQTRNFKPSKSDLSILQQRIVKNIFQKIVFPPHIMGGIKGKDSIKNALAHKGKKFKFKTDIIKFFPSISDKMVYEMLLDIGFSRDVTNILTKLTTVSGELPIRPISNPQGASTSTYIANLVFLKIDKEILKITSENKITYTRFVDDLVFSSETDFLDIIPQLLKVIHKNGFKISRDKTKYRSKKLDVTGIEVGMNCIKPVIKPQKNPTSEKSRIGRELYEKRVRATNKRNK